MIEGFRHKGLRQLYENDNRRLLTADMVERIRVILAALDSLRPSKILTGQARLHPLKGDRKGQWSITVRAWQIVFRFESGSARDVDLVDYH